MSRRESVGGKPMIDKTRQAANRIAAEREARREQMKARKIERAAEERRNVAAGNPGDIDFISLVREWRIGMVGKEEHLQRGVSKICICVRKRPISNKERAKKDHDSITCSNPTVHVHSAKLKVDGITKYLDNNSFRFDHSFDESESTQDVYKYTTMPLVDFVTAGKGGRATCFAYGQTGSGKTYTMSGIQVMVAEDIFMLLGEGKDGCKNEDTVVTVSMFELYGGRCQDLLNDRTRLKILEDGKGEVVVTGLEEYQASDPNDFLTLIDAGNRNRTTHATEANDTSSRSHAVCQILLRDRTTGKLKGKLSLVDLAGSERGSDTKSHNRQRRTESSEINKSLLALKECIRALDSGGGHQHVPYRASKLTLVLKDCFTSPLARTTMIATVSPGASAADHTLNTLRYADRVKEKKVGGVSAARQAEIAREQEAKRERQQVAARELRMQYNQDSLDSSELPPPPQQMEKRKFVSKENIERRLDANAQRKAGVGGERNKSSRHASAKSSYGDVSPPRSPHRNARSAAEASSKSRASPKGAGTPPRRKQTIESKLTAREEKKGGSSSPQDEAFDDVKMLHESLRSHGDGGMDDDAVALLHKTVDEIFEEEEQLLNLHMSTIQESAELLTSEGKLLQMVQGQDDYEIDSYAEKLEEILERKMTLTENLSRKLKKFRESLRKEELLSQRVENMPAY